MKKFRIVVHCKNLNVPDEEDGKNIIGFFTTRYARGKSIEEAIEKAKDCLRNEKDYKNMVRITKQNSQLEPIFEIDEFEEVSLYSWLLAKNKGYTFYPAD